MLEIVTMDADRGAVFYILSNTDGRPAFEREAMRCLICHDSYSMLGGGVPRFLFESTYDVQHGMLTADAVVRETSDATPVAERWGGWYVTGEDGGARAPGQHTAPGHDPPRSRSRKSGAAVSPRSIHCWRLPPTYDIPATLSRY